MSDALSPEGGDTVLNKGEASGISDFVFCLRELSTGVLSVDKRREAVDKALLSFALYPKMTESLLRSSVVMELSSRGSREIDLALSSRWSKIRVSQIASRASNAPLGVSLEIFFIQEKTHHDDPTDEMFTILCRYIENNDYHYFVKQLVVNDKVKKFLPADDSDR